METPTFLRAQTGCLPTFFRVSASEGHSCCKRLWAFLDTHGGMCCGPQCHCCKRAHLLFLCVLGPQYSVVCAPHTKTPCEESDMYDWFAEFEKLVICRLQTVAIQLEHAGVCKGIVVMVWHVCMTTVPLGCTRRR